VASRSKPPKRWWTWANGRCARRDGRDAPRWSTRACCAARFAASAGSRSRAVFRHVPVACASTRWRSYAPETCPGAAADVRHGRWFAAAGADSAIEALYSQGGARRPTCWPWTSKTWSPPAAAHRARRLGHGRAVYRAAWEVLELKGPYASAVRARRSPLSRFADRDADLRRLGSRGRRRMAHRPHRVGRSTLEALCRESLEAGDRRSKRLPATSSAPPCANSVALMRRAQNWRPR
jgi:hypothetical protein